MRQFMPGDAPNPSADINEFAPAIAFIQSAARSRSTSILTISPHGAKMVASSSLLSV